MNDVHKIWSELRSLRTKPSDAGFRMRLIKSGEKWRAYAAIKVNAGTVGMVLEVPSSAMARRRFKLITHAFRVEGSTWIGFAKGQKAVVVQLTDPTFHDLFGLLAEEILDALKTAKSPQDAVQVLMRTIERWKTFLGAKSQRMTMERERGLIAELAVLARLVASRGAPDSIECWLGPADGIRDFEFTDLFVEVKSYQPQSGRVVRINGVLQLEGTPAQPPMLCVVPLLESPKGISLPDVAQLVRETIGDQVEARLEFEDRLAQAGYSRAHAGEYSDRFKIGPAELYQVGPGFPRISSEQILPGVSEVRFNVDLNALVRFKVDCDSLLGKPHPKLEGKA